jgi:hypothetical protein
VQILKHLSFQALQITVQNIQQALQKPDHSRDQGVDARIGSECIIGTLAGLGGVDSGA